MGKMSSTTNGCCSFVPDDQLVFRFEPNKNIPVSLQMKNNTDKSVAFKVRTTNPKKYCVTPSRGIVSGNVSRDIVITLNAQKTTPANVLNCRDKFLILTTVVGPSVKTVTSELFDKAEENGQVQQTKLRVHMMPSAQPPSPVPEETSKIDESVQTGIPVLTGPRVTFADEQQMQQAQTGQLQQQRVVIGEGFGVMYVLCVALIAFLLGYFSRGNIPALDVLKTAIVNTVWGSGKHAGFLKFLHR